MGNLILRKQLAYTLIELLIVIGIVAVLAAILFPVFLTVRAKARQGVCISNLRQIGQAVFLYAQDYDSLYPEGADPVDKYTNDWFGTPYAQIAPNLVLLPQLLNPYSKDNRIWMCPSDVGFDEGDYGAGPDSLSAHPSSFKQYGMSYYYRTAIGLTHQTLSGLVAYDLSPPYLQHGPSEVNLLSDGSGTWHGGANEDGRYDVLMGDGHVKNMTYSALANAWALTLGKPQTP